MRPSFSRRRARGNTRTGLPRADRDRCSRRPACARPGRCDPPPRPPARRTTRRPAPRLPARHAAALDVDAGHVSLAHDRAVEGARDAPIAAVRHVQRTHHVETQHLARHLSVHERLHLMGKHRAARLRGGRCRIQRVVAIERPLVVDNHRLAGPVHVDAVHTAAQQASCVRERLARAEIELEAHGLEARQQQRLAVEEPDEPLPQIGRLGAFEGGARDQRVDRALEVALRFQMAVERLA